MCGLCVGFACVVLVWFGVCVCVVCVLFVCGGGECVFGVCGVCVFGVWVRACVCVVCLFLCWVFVCVG